MNALPRIRYKPDRRDVREGRVVTRFFFFSELLYKMYRRDAKPLECVVVTPAPRLFYINSLKSLVSLLPDLTLRLTSDLRLRC